MRTLNAIDLCSGAGGWAVAARGLPINFVAIADLAEDYLETWKLNHADQHPECQVLNVNLTTAEGIARVRQAIGKRRIDIVLGGIPCEEVSTARSGTKVPPDKMNAWWSLIDHVLELTRTLKPAYWAIEDVIQIEKHLPTPLEHGHIPMRRLQAADYGPQRRLRTYLGAFPTPQPEPTAPRTLGDCLLPGPWQTERNIDRYAEAPHGRNAACVGNDLVRVLDPSQPSPTVLGALDRGSRQRRSFMVRAADGRLRKLDWRECAALQGFPPDYIFVGGLMRVQKMIGQAISIHCGRAILQAMCERRTAAKSKQTRQPQKV